MRGDPTAFAKACALRKAAQVHGNTKPRPRIQTPDFDALFGALSRARAYTINDLCSSCAISRKQARIYFGRKTLCSRNFPESTEDVFLDAARDGLVAPPRPWLETLYTPQEAATVFKATLNRSMMTLYRAIQDGELPAYHFSGKCIRIRREDLQAYILKRLGKKGILVP